MTSDGSYRAAAVCRRCGRRPISWICPCVESTRHLDQRAIFGEISYALTDKLTGVEIQRLSVELFVRNLTNEDAFTWRGLNGGFNPFAGHRMRPRTVGVQLGYRFE